METRTLRLSYTNKATIPTGIPYENQTPCYTVTQEIPIPCFMDDQAFVEKETELQINWMKGYIDSKINRDFELLAKFRGIEALPDWHRIDVIDEQVYPHISEIIEPAKPLFIKYLDAHSYLGTLLDSTFKDYYDLGEWVYRDSKDTSVINQSYEDLFQLGWDWIEEYKDYIQLMEHSIKVINPNLRFVGELDQLCMIDGQFGIADFKKTKVLSKERKEVFFMKMAAYAKNLPDIIIEKYGQPQFMTIISPYNPLTTCEDIEDYYNKFILKRQVYSTRFGI